MVLVSFWRNFRSLGQALPLFGSEIYANFIYDLRRHAILQSQHIANLTLVRIGPKMVVGGDLNQFGRDPNAAAHTHHRAFDDGIDVQFAGNFREWLTRSLVSHGGRS